MRVPKRFRGDVMLDAWRLYVVLSTVVDVDFVLYKCMVLAFVGSEQIASAIHPGMICTFGEGVELDTHVGETKLPATL